MKLATLSKIAFIFAGAAAMTGCAAPLVVPVANLIANKQTNEGNVQERTAKYFGVEPAKVVVSNYDEGLVTTTFHARVDNKFYNCRVYYGDLACKAPGSGSF